MRWLDHKNKCSRVIHGTKAVFVLPNYVELLFVFSKQITHTLWLCLCNTGINYHAFRWRIRGFTVQTNSETSDVTNMSTYVFCCEQSSRRWWVSANLTVHSKNMLLSRVYQGKREVCRGFLYRKRILRRVFHSSWVRSYANGILSRRNNVCTCRYMTWRELSMSLLVTTVLFMVEWGRGIRASSVQFWSFTIKNLNNSEDIIITENEYPNSAIRAAIYFWRANCRRRVDINLWSSFEWTAQRYRYAIASIKIITNEPRQNYWNRWNEKS